MKLLDDVAGSAIISSDGLYRYVLVREWNAGAPVAVWVMLNPSTANAERDDVTLRKVQAYSRREGAGIAVVVNLFAYRATSPSELRVAEDPVGPENDAYLEAVLGKDDVSFVVAAWGANAEHWNHRVQAVYAIAARHCRPLYRLGSATKGGHPRHPCRVGHDLALELHW